MSNAIKSAQLLRVSRNGGWLTPDGYKRLRLVRDAIPVGWVTHNEAIGRHNGKLVRMSGDYSNGVPQIILYEKRARRAPAEVISRRTHIAEPATDRQMALLGRLVKRKYFLTFDQVARVNTLKQQVVDGPFSDLSKRDASKAIDWLKGLPRNVKEAGEVVADMPHGDLRVDGIYQVHDHADHPHAGDVYKVQRAIYGSNRFYAKKMIRKPEGGISWDFKTAVYERATTWLRHEWKLNEGQAKRLGVLYGTCVRCGRTLTKEESIDRKSGDTCAAYIAHDDWGTFDNR